MAGLAAALLNLLNSPTNVARFAALSEAELSELAGRIVANDAYGENSHMQTALSIVGLEPGLLVDHVEHQLWCTWRAARNCTGARAEMETRADPDTVEALASPVPTVLLAVMTLPVDDSIQTLRRVLGTRPMKLYGEGVQAIPGIPAEWILPQGAAAIRRILSLFAANGTLATYCDFVYQGHRSEPIEPFGRVRPVSSAFIGPISRPGVRVLPIVLRRCQGAAVVITRPALFPHDRNHALQVVQSEFEQLVRIAGHQWLLMPTLTFSNPQLARLE